MGALREMPFPTPPDTIEALSIFSDSSGDDSSPPPMVDIAFMVISPL
jgi:hypothetical protein